MDFEVHDDPAVYRRSRNGAILFLLSILSIFAATIGIPPLLAALPISQGAGRSVLGMAIFAGFVGFIVANVYGTWHLFSYRCPRCRRRLPRVFGQDAPEGTLHYGCEDCRVIWDLGWAWGGEGGVGG